MTWHRATFRAHTPPIEMRFIDMFMAALGALLFMAMLFAVLVALSPRGASSPDGGTAPRRTLQILTKRLPAAAIGHPYEIALSAAGASRRLHWTVTGAVPDWLHLDGDTGILTGTPSTPLDAPARFVVRAAEEDGGIAQTELELRLTAQVELRPLAIVSGERLPPATVNAPYEFQLAAEGGVPPYRFKRGGSWPELTAGSIEVSPSGLLTNAVLPSERTHRLEVVVEDRVGNRAERTFRLPVRARDRASPPVERLRIRNGAELPCAHLGEAYRADIAVEGGVAPYRYALAGPLPAGLSLLDGRIEGRPTARIDGAQLELTVRDAQVPPETAQATLSLSVRQVRSPWWKLFATTFVLLSYLFFKQKVNDGYYFRKREELFKRGLKLLQTETGVFLDGPPPVQQEFRSLSRADTARVAWLRILHLGAAILLTGYLLHDHFWAAKPPAVPPSASGVPPAASSGRGA